MRKIICFMMISLDGYFEAPGHDLAWHNVDDEFNRFALKQMDEVDTIMFGRRMYKTMESFWPDAEDDPRMSRENIAIAHKMNTTEKLVFSRTLKSVRKHKNWKNVKIVNRFDPREIMRLKRRPGKSMWVGGSNLASAFIKAGLVDELRLMVNPIFIGKGTPLFGDVGGKFRLKLIDIKKFSSGNVLLRYRPYSH